MKLLIVEDDMLLQEGLALALTAEGYTLDCAATAAEADGLIQSGEYSLVILDLGLPDKDGATLLSQWRRRGVANPVLILTARDALAPVSAMISVLPCVDDALRENQRGSAH
jgi:two-component system response regulator BasR